MRQSLPALSCGDVASVTEDLQQTLIRIRVWVQLLAWLGDAPFIYALRPEAQSLSPNQKDSWG